MTKINNEGLTWYSGGTAVMIAKDPNVKGFNSWTLPEGQLGLGHCARGAGPLVPGLHRRVIQRSLPTH